MKRYWIGFVLAGILVLVVVLVFSPWRQTSGEVKVGAVLPLTGSAAILGNGIREGMEIAAKEINAAGGIHGHRLKLAFSDSRNDAKEGLSGLTRLIDVEKVPAVVVAMSSVTAATIPIADRRKIVLFATVTAAPKLTHSSVWVYRNYYTTDVQGSVMAHYLSKVGRRSVSVIYVNDDYGVTGLQAFRQEFTGVGGQLLSAEAYDKNASDMRAQITKVMSGSPKAVLVIAYGKGLALVVKQLRQLGFQGTILSYTGLIDPDVMKQAGSAAEGAIVIASTFDPSRPLGVRQSHLVNAYKEAYGKLPSHYVAFGYDTLSMLAEAMRQSGTSSAEIRDGLTGLGKLELSLGPIQIQPTREVSFEQRVRSIKAGSLVDPPEELR